MNSPTVSDDNTEAYAHDLGMGVFAIRSHVVNWSTIEDTLYKYEARTKTERKGDNYAYVAVSALAPVEEKSFSVDRSNLTERHTCWSHGF